MTQPSRVQQWIAGGLRTVMLPTGIVFAFRIPDPEDLVSRGVVPEDLREVALRLKAGGVETQSLDVEELRKLLRTFRGMIAQMLRYVWAGPIEPIDAWLRFDASLIAEGGWEPVTLTGADFEEVQIEGDDYAALQAIIQRQVTAKGITALSLRDHNLITLQQFDQMIAGDEAAKKVGTWESFRFGRGRSEHGANGGDVGREAVEHDPDQRPANRAARRRSTSNQARRVPKGRS